MGLAQQFERRLEALFEGVFSRGSRSGLEPLELARKLQREMGKHRRVGLHGEVLVANHFSARVAPEDHERLAPIEHALCLEIATMLRQQASDEGWGLIGPVEVTLIPDEGVRQARMVIDAAYREPEGPTGGMLILADGRSVELSDRVRIGRLPDCELPLSDPNISRHHAEIAWDGRGYVVRDLGSMNGTQLNDAPVTEARLNPGDIVTVGRTRIEVRIA